MRVATIVSPRHVELQDLPVPDLAPGQVRVRVSGIGICGSNLPVWEGRPWFRYPLPPGAPGHEPWGHVDRIGAGVTGFAEGDPVVFLCDQAFAEYAIADADNVVRLPAAIAERAFPGEPLACAVNVLHRCRIQNGERVAVVGVGFLGAVIVALAHAAGARVTAISRRASALDMARRMGAESTMAFESDAIRDHAATFTCVIEAVGEQRALDVAADLVAERGRLVIAGYHQDGLRQVNMQSWNWRGLDVINAHERDPAVYARGLRESVHLVATGQLDPSPLYTHSYTLDRLDQAFEAAMTRPEGFMKALVTL
jgi:NADPH2:quinone reductase